MRNRLSVFILFLGTAGFSLAQDMPPLPPLPNQTASTPSSSSDTSSPALPPLPDQPSAPASNSGAASPPLPDASTSSPQANNGGLPPLPDQKTAPADNSTAMPPLPGQSATTTAPAGTEAASAPSTEVKPVKKSVNQPWWTKTKARPNVIFAGWVKAKGGNESSRIAWTSQEVLNALVFKGYKVVKEDGKYDGQEGAGGHQWREITFSVPKSKLTTQVYIKQSGKKVWVRVGPSEPPAFANHSIAQVQKMREANLKALRLVQKKLGRRLSPHRTVRSYEAPYNYSKEAVVE